MEKIFRKNCIISYMNSICSLVQRIFPFNKMKHLANTNSIATRYDCRFIKFITIFPTYFLRANKERIKPLYQFLVCVAASCTYICNFTECHKFYPPPDLALSNSLKFNNLSR